MKLNKSKYLLCALLGAAVFFSGCAAQEKTADTTVAESVSSSITENAEVLSAKTYTGGDAPVKLIGRTHTENEILWLAHSASGIEFTFKGDFASVTLAGDGAAFSNKDSQARFAVYINGERTMDEQIDSAEKTYDIYSGEEASEVTVKLLKLSESANSTFGIKSIDVNSVNEISPTAEKNMKIEFIGDSITCGYGVDDEVKEHHFSTSTEDATRAYAFKTAELLDADYSLVSYSGHGIISGYSGDGKKQTSQLVPKLYEQFARSYGSSNGYFSISDDWDFSRFVPDFVVINLGTNDESYTKKDKEKIADYQTSYVEFIKMVRRNNPEAYIICALGVMGDGLYPAVENAVSDYIVETGDNNVSAFHLTPQNGSTGFAADWHPTEATHEIAAKELSEYIKTIDK